MSNWLQIYQNIQSSKGTELAVGCSIRWRSIHGEELGAALVEEVIRLPTLQHSNISPMDAQAIETWAFATFNHVGRWISTKIITDVLKDTCNPLDPKRKGPSS